MISPRGLAAACLLLWCPASVAAQTGTVAVDTRPLVLADATIVSLTGAPPLGGQSIVVQSGRIVSIGPTATTTPPAGSRVIHLRGQVVIPGLADMHVHNIARDRWQ